MNHLQMSKVHVEYRGGMEPARPMTTRKYTLTHSDETGNLYLALGPDYALDRITNKRDEVLAEFVPGHNGCPVFRVYVYVGGKEGEPEAANRSEVFRRELPLALSAIRYGDRALFEALPELDRAPVEVVYNADLDAYKRTERMGTLGDFRHGSAARSASAARRPTEWRQNG